MQDTPLLHCLFLHRLTLYPKFNIGGGREGGSVCLWWEAPSKEGFFLVLSKVAKHLEQFDNQSHFHLSVRSN